MSDWWNQPTRVEGQPPAAPVERLPACPWCAAPAAPDASSCPNCGAVMAQHEDLGGLIIPGVTAVDPAMQARGYASSAIGSQARMSTLSMLGGGPGGTMVQVAAAAVMLAGDRGQGAGGTANPEDVGRPSQAALDMAELLRQPAPEPELAAAEPDASEPGSGVDTTEETL